MRTKNQKTKMKEEKRKNVLFKERSLAKFSV